MNERRFAVRTVRHGRVKIGQAWFVPQEYHQPYRGELDGRRYAFGRYREFVNHGAYLPFVSLWGTERAFVAGEDDRSDPYIVNGTMPWMFWERCQPDIAELGGRHDA